LLKLHGFLRDGVIFRTTVRFLSVHTGISQKKEIAKHQFFDTTDPKFDKYYSNLFFPDLVYKNNRLKYIRVLFFDLFWQEFCSINI